MQQCLPRPEQRACWPKWHPSIPSTTEPGLKSTIGGFKSAKAVPGIDIKTALLDSVDSVASGKLSVKDWQAKVNEASNKLGGY